jgi:hypothetical protein
MSPTILITKTEAIVTLPFPAWVFGVIVLLVFAALAFVVWTYRDVAHRHNHKPIPGAADHAGAPGASSHGSGHEHGPGH